jgi:DNA-binding transcriptional LysR family regulator
LRAYPEFDVRLLLVDRFLSLPEDHVDVALRIGELPDSRLITLRLGTIGTVVCASPAYLKARGVPRTPDDLAAHDCIIYEGFIGPYVRKASQARAVTMRSRTSGSSK